MPSIKRSKLVKIIQEEVEKTVVKEGFIEDLVVIGKDIGKYLGTVKSRGAEIAMEKSGDKAKREMVSALERSLVTLKKEFKRSSNPKLQQKIGEVEASIVALKQGGTAGEVVGRALAAGADPSGGEESLRQLQRDRGATRAAADLAARAKKEAADEKGAEGGAAEVAADPKEQAAAATAVVRSPTEIASLVIQALNQYTSGRISADKSIPFLKKSIEGSDAKFLKTLKNKIAIEKKKAAKKAGTEQPEEPAAEEKLAAEGLLPGTKISKFALREAIRLMQNGI